MNVAIRCFSTLNSQNTEEKKNEEKSEKKKRRKVLNLHVIRWNVLRKSDKAKRMHKEIFLKCRLWWKKRRGNYNKNWHQQKISVAVWHNGVSNGSKATQRMVAKWKLTKWEKEIQTNEMIHQTKLHANNEGRVLTKENVIHTETKRARKRTSKTFLHLNLMAMIVALTTRFAYS